MGRRKNVTLVARGVRLYRGRPSAWVIPVALLLGAALTALLKPLIELLAG